MQTTSNDDLNHPIPRLGVIDIHGFLKTGGTDLVVVIGSPLEADDNSRSRLLQKLGNYAAYIGSSEYADQFGRPTPENTTIVVNIHPGSSPKVFELLELWRPHAVAAHANLRIELLEVGE